MKPGLKGKRDTGNKVVTDPGGKNASQAKAIGGVDLKKGYNVVGRPGVLESPKGKRKS